jgi:glycosyltransferase involved in cell wall biosynthesis
MSAPAVMQLCLTLDTGGLERVVVCLANTLASRHGLDSHIVTVGKTTSELIPAGIDKRVMWTELSGPTRFSFKIAWKLASYIRQKNIRIVHAHGTQPLVYALMVSLITPIEIVATKHNSYDDLGFFRKRPFFRRLACSRVKQFIGVSEAATEMLQKVFAPAADRCTTQINGTPLPSPSLRMKAQTVRQSGALNAPLIISTVCRLVPEKDLSTLIRAFASVRDTQRNVELWIVGDGPERGMLADLCERLDVKKAVRFWGFRGRIEQILACSDIFVNSSVTEGISISILEAMSMSLPVVATAVGGTPKIVRDEENGLLVPPQQPEELAVALLELLENPESRRRMGVNSFQQVTQSWSLERMTDNYLALYGLSAAA